MNRSHTAFLATAAVAFALILTPSVEARPLPSAEEGEGFRVVAEIALEGAKLTFVDETVRGIFGFGILEEGKIDLAPFYERGATALEIYLALAPEGSEVPPALWKAHEAARALDPAVPAEPRAELIAGGAGSAAAKAVAYYTFDHDTNNCWGWGGVASYNSLVGNKPGNWNGHASTQAYNEFKTWSTISGFLTSSAAYYEENAELSDQFYATPYGHDRALAICVTHALVQPGESAWSCAVEDGVDENSVRYRVRLRGQQQGGGTWTVDTIYLEGYGEGARYRSSSSAKRKYTLEVVDVSKKSLVCKEKFEVFTRSKTDLSGPGGFTF